MSESFVTQCPHCGTTFRVTDQHLNAAQGSVRCGACLKIFSARDHLMQKAAAPVSAPAPVRAPASQPKQTENTQPRSTFSAQKDDDDLVFEDDPTFDSEEDLDESPNPKGGHAPEDDDFGFGEITEEMETVRPDLRAQKAHVGTAPPEHLVDSMWDSLDDTLFEEEAPHAEPITGPSLDNFTAENLHIDASDDNLDLDIDFPGSPKRPLQKAKFHSDMVDHIESGPLELNFDHRRESRNRWLWASGSFVLMLALITQIAWFGMPVYAKNSTLRPWYDKACELADCELPGLVDVRQFRTGNLILRKDVRNPSNLIVDAILINQANFEQPFPSLILEFRNLAGVLVADGLFNPAQYLNGEMTGVQLMPSKTPVHVSFSVVSPGADAVNYSIRYQ